MIYLRFGDLSTASFVSLVERLGVANRLTNCYDNIVVK